MDKKKLFWKGMTVVLVVAAIILAAWHIIGFKVVEETFTLEVLKRIFVSLGILVIVGGIAYPLVGIWASRKAGGMEG